MNLGQYAREMRFAWVSGCTLRDKFGVAAATPDLGAIIAELHPPASFDQFESAFGQRGFEIAHGRMMPTALRREPQP
jgi:hypothetical protein